MATIAPTSAAKKTYLPHTDEESNPSTPSHPPPQSGPTGSVEDWSVGEVSAWLRGHNRFFLAGRAEEMGIDGGTMVELDKGGWEVQANAECFGRFARKVAPRLAAHCTWYPCAGAPTPD